MKPHALIMSSNYKVVVSGLRELHALTIAGRLDSPEADAVRDATDVPWSALTETEKNRLSGLSEDLYLITDPVERLSGEFDLQIQASLNNLIQAKLAKDWEETLKWARVSRLFLKPATLSYVLGSAWMDGGDPGTAVIFFKHAADLDPQNSDYYVFYLNAQNEFNPKIALYEAQEVLNNPASFGPQIIVCACYLLLESTKNLSAFESSSILRKMIGELNNSLTQMELEVGRNAIRTSYLSACTILGISHELLGENQAAIASYTKSLAIAPDDALALTARGILRYGESELAIDDLQLSIQNGIQVVWPYYFLAHYHLSFGQFDLSRHYCERGLALGGSDVIKSELAEWLGVCQAELRFPADIIRNSFERAIRFNPSNEEAHRNFTTFEAIVNNGLVSRYETRTSASVRATGLSERRLYPLAA